MAPGAGDGASEELALLIDGAQGYALYLLDAAGRVSIWNRGAQRLLGWTEDQVIGRDAAIFYPADAVEAGRPGKDLAEAGQSGKFTTEDWRVRQDGAERSAERRVGKECGRTCRSWWGPVHKKKKQ